MTVGVHRRLSTDSHGRAAPVACSGLTRTAGSVVHPANRTRREPRVPVEDPMDEYRPRRTQLLPGRPRAAARPLAGPATILHERPRPIHRCSTPRRPATTGRSTPKVNDKYTRGTWQLLSPASVDELCSEVPGPGVVRVPQRVVQAVDLRLRIGSVQAALVPAEVHRDYHLPELAGRPGPGRRPSAARPCQAVRPAFAANPRRVNVPGTAGRSAGWGWRAGQ
jgi:hypothetical protein